MACSTLNFLILSDSCMKIASFVTRKNTPFSLFCLYLSYVLACIFCRKTVKMCHVGGLDAGCDKCHKTAVMPPEQDAEVIRPDIGKLTERQGIFPAARLDREAGAAVVLNEPVLISRVAGGVGRGRDVIAAHGGKLPGDRFASRHVVAVILPVDDAALRVVRQGEQRSSARVKPYIARLSGATSGAGPT